MDSTNRRESYDWGRDVERLAEAKLSSLAGWKFLGRNFRRKGGEIDLVYEQERRGGLELVFVEVRARHREGWVTSVESVDVRKQRRLVRAARDYLAKYRGEASGVRFDVVGFDGRNWVHLENALSL